VVVKKTQVYEKRKRFRDDPRCRLEAFFEFIAEWRPANKDIYVEVLCRLRNAVRRKWARNSWLLHDTAPAHRSLAVKKCLASTM
jgi:hypothetical protein